MSKVWECSPHSDDTLLTFLALADWSDDDGFCFPGIAQIAKKSRQSERNAKRCIRRLVDEEFLSIVDSGGGRGNRPKYQINIDKLSYFSKLKGDNQNAERVTMETLKGDNGDIAIRKNRQEPSVNPLPPLEKQNASLEDQQLIEMDKYSAAKTLGELIGVGHSGGKGLHRLTSAIEQAQRRWPEKPIIDVIKGVASLWREYCAQGHHAPVAIHNWLDTVGSFIDSNHWRKAKKPEFIPQVDWQGGHIAADGVYVNKHGKRVPGFICPSKPKEMAGD